MTDYSQTQWRDAVHAAATEIAKIALGFAGARVDDSQGHPTEKNLLGAHIGMVGRPSYQLSMIASRESCEALATAVLGMPASTLPPSVVSDALGEIVNQLAGSVKRRLGARDHELGLPIAITGSFEPSERLHVLAFPVSFGPIETTVVIVEPR